MRETVTYSDKVELSWTQTKKTVTSSDGTEPIVGSEKRKKYNEAEILLVQFIYESHCEGKRP